MQVSLSPDKQGKLLTGLEVMAKLLRASDMDEDKAILFLKQQGVWDERNCKALLTGAIKGINEGKL